MSGPIPRIPSGLLAPLAWGYGCAVAARNLAFDAGFPAGQSIQQPVISIGNLVAGGSGKTPMTAWIARRLRKAGFRPLIALRGYGAREPSTADEAMEYASLLPRVPLAVGADRVAAIARACAALSVFARPDVVLLDDGFQHRRIDRTLDLVLVDAGRPCLEGPDAALLPKGWLREPPRALRRAHAVILTHAEAPAPRLVAAVERLHGQPPIARFRHLWTGLSRYEPAHHAGPAPSAGEAPLAWLPVEALRGMRVVTLLGVAQPARVRAMLETWGATVVEDIPVRDHQRYDSRLIERVARAASRGEALFTTPKDWTKLAAHTGTFERPILVPRLEVEAVEGEEALVKLLLSAADSA